METILVPVDFSKRAINAAIYAIRFAKFIEASRIILLNSYYVSVYESILPSADFIQLSNEEINQKRESLLRRLRALKARLQPLAGDNLAVEYQLSDLSLLRAIQQVSEEEGVDLAVIASAGENVREEGVLGRNTVAIAKTCPVPVIVCPPGTEFSGIKRVILACDLNRVAETVRLDELKRIFKKNKPEFIVLNVDPGNRHLHPRGVLEESALKDMLKDFNTEYHYATDSDTIDGIIRFALSKEAQLIIVFAKKYGLLQGMVHNSVSQNLALKAKTPLLILK